MSETTLIHGGHLDDPPEFAIPLLAAYAIAVLNWGRLEQHMDMALITVNKAYFKPKKERITPNTSFELKRALFRDWFTRDPRFSLFKEDAARLSRSLKHASADRIWLAHSNMQRFIEGPPIAVEIVNIRSVKGNVIQSRAIWTIDQIRDVAAVFNELNTQLKNITDRALTVDFLKSLEKS